jgi:preprotein translocase subunit Sss1
MGARWALLPAFLFAFSPTVIAHGHYVTTDIAASFGFLVATYGFVHYLLHPSLRTLLYAGLAFGVAQLLKFSAILLVPFFILLVLTQIVAAFLRMRRGPLTSSGWSPLFKLSKEKILGLIMIGLIGFVLVIYPVYFLFTVRYPIDRQVQDTTTILKDFGKLQKPLPVLHCTPGRCLANVDIWMAGNPVLRPFGQYFLGVLMVLTRSSGGNTGYFFGELSRDGWLAYFPALYVMKETIPTLLLVLIALLVSIGGIIRAIRRKQSHFLDYLETNFPEFSMALIVAIYWAYSMKSPLNIGLRHLLPTFPFIYILTAGAIKRWVTAVAWPETKSPLKLIGAWLKGIFATSIKSSFVFLLLFWLLLETLFAAPYFLSYYNEFGGGTSEGYRYVTDSNYDWGQDMLRLQDFVAAHGEIDKIGVDYFGGGMPDYYLGPKEVNWWSGHGNPANENIHWLAVSVNTLESARAKLVGSQERNKDDEYQWLVDIRPPMPGMGSVPPPDFRIGTSLFVYHL